LFRIIVIFQEPVLSDDVFRYIWDGRVSINGINPYRYAPTHENLRFLRDSEIYPHINFPDIATVYPPFAQLFFAFNAIIGNTIFSWKIVLLVLELFLTFVLLKLIHHFNLNSMRLFIFTLNPLVIIETYQNGHIEIIGLVFFWFSILLFFRQKAWQSIMAATLATMTKFLPLVMFLPFLIKKFWRKFLLIVSAVTVVILPFFLDDTIPMAGFISYANRWSFNGSMFKVGTALLNWIGIRSHEIGIYNLNGHLETVYINTEFYYKILAAVVLLIVIIDQMRKVKILADFATVRFIQAGFIIGGTLLLLLPTLHPWYLIWVIPFLIFLPRWSWLVFTFLIQFAYFVLKNYHEAGIWEESVWVLVLQYIPFYALLIYEYLDRKRIRGWML